VSHVVDLDLSLACDESQLETNLLQEGKKKKKKKKEKKKKKRAS